MSKANQAEKTVKAVEKNETRWQREVRDQWQPQGTTSWTAYLKEKTKDRINDPSALANSEATRPEDGEVTVVDNERAIPKARRAENKEQGKLAPPKMPKDGWKPASAKPFTIVGGGSYETLEALEADLPSRPARPITIIVEEKSRVAVRSENVLHFYHEDRPLIIDGNGAQVDGTQEDGTPTMGYFLSYRPKVQPSAGPVRVDSDKQPKKKRPRVPPKLTVRNLSIRGFVCGGIEISPVTRTAAEVDPTAPGSEEKVKGHNYETWVQRLPESAKQGRSADDLKKSFENLWELEQGGNGAHLQGALIERVDFRDLGDAKMNREQRQPSWELNEFGSGGVMMRGVSDARILNNQFEHLQNDTGSKLNDKSNIEEIQNNDHLFHAVYMNNRSCLNVIRGNSFNDVSGDVVRISQGSDHNRIVDNRSQNSGIQGLVNNWYSVPAGTSTENARLANSIGTEIRDNQIGSLNGSRGQTQGVAYTRRRKDETPR